MHDLAIEGGTIVDGTGGKPFVADINITDGRIASIGQDVLARERIDARGLIVTPGFIDIHTHFDAQVMWDATLAPVVWHGVTTAVMGNFGVGFAPVKQEGRRALIDLMASVGSHSLNI